MSVGYNGMPNGIGFKDSEMHSAVRSDTDPETSLKEYSKGHILWHCV